MAKITLLSISAISILCIQFLNAAVLEVGNGKKYDSIQKAWQAAKEGDEVIVYPGIYEPVANGRCLQVAGKKGIVLRTSGDGEVVCKGGFYFYKGKFSYILIQGFTFKGATRGIWLDGRGTASFDNIIIRDNIFANCSHEALYFYNKTDSQKFSNIIVENNTMFKNYVGIHHYVVGNGGNCNWVFRNNITINNKVGILSKGASSFNYSNSWQNPPKGNSNWIGKNCKGTGCVSIDPLFVSTDNASKDFLKLSAQSPKSVLSGGFQGAFMGALGKEGRVKRDDYKAFYDKLNPTRHLLVKTKLWLKLLRHISRSQGEYSLILIIMANLTLVKRGCRVYLFQMAWKLSKVTIMVYIHLRAFLKKFWPVFLLLCRKAIKPANVSFILYRQILQELILVWCVIQSLSKKNSHSSTVRTFSLTSYRKLLNYATSLQVLSV
jgi:hypothetical protein